jgi:hypothetical protein
MRPSHETRAANQDLQFECNVIYEEGIEQDSIEALVNDPKSGKEKKEECQKEDIGVRRIKVEREDNTKQNVNAGEIQELTNAKKRTEKKKTKKESIKQMHIKLEKEDCTKEQDDNVGAMQNMCMALCKPKFLYQTPNGT